MTIFGRWEGGKPFYRASLGVYVSFKFPPELRFSDHFIQDGLVCFGLHLPHANWCKLRQIEWPSIWFNKLQIDPKPMVLEIKSIKNPGGHVKSHPSRSHPGFQARDVHRFLYKMTWRGSWWLFLVDGRGANHFIEHHWVFMCLSNFRRNQGFLTISSKMVWYVLVYIYHMQIEANWVALNLIQQASIFPPKPMVLVI